MARSNDEVAALFQEYADLISITGGDAFNSGVRAGSRGVLTA
ncbi:helix-hairpin-helix domain-containing protein [Streptomyces bobili]